MAAERGSAHLPTWLAMGAWLLGLQLCGAWQGETPGLAVLMPVPIVLLALAGLPGFLGTAIPAVVFFFWSGRVRPVSSKWPRRIALLLLGLLSMVYVTTAWPYGVEYQGQAHTAYAVGLDAVVWCVALPRANDGRRTALTSPRGACVVAHRCLGLPVRVSVPGRAALGLRQVASPSGAGGLGVRFDPEVDEEDA